MPALVPELVKAAIDATVSPGDLLRRALVVARRLAVPELVDWISSELNGYYSREVPDYRRVQGQLIAENPINGPIPGVRHLTPIFAPFRKVPSALARV